MKLSHSILILFPLLLAGCSNKTQEENKPNILIILADDQGNADAGYQRSPSIVSTPAIDAIANDGIVFTNAYASAYVCAPTRAGLLTGRYQQRFGFYRAPDSRVGMPLSEVTLADVLKKEGYRTGVFGKWHLGLTEEYNPVNRGFDTFYGFLGHGGRDYFDLTLHEDPDGFHQPIYRNLQPVSDTGYLTDNIARETANFIKECANQKEPFFAYMAFNAVHSPMQAPEKDIDMFDSGDPRRDIYLAMLHRMDIGIEKVIRVLKKEGVYDNTLVFYFSDNGGARNNSSDNLPFRDYKQSVYEGGLRVPFIISWPDRLAPSTCDEPVISIDIMPTICAVLDIDLPVDHIYDGKNIFSVIEDHIEDPLHDQLYFDGNDRSWAVREGAWKLLLSRRGNMELYNLDSDPYEEKNLVDEHPGIVKDLKQKYTNWRSEMGTPIGGN
ncbi:MAG: sulfatase-like hydrolase/transferase [Bacteroidales bacterium]